MDPHDVLGVTAGASDDEIRAAFRRYATRTHPDRGGDPDRFIAGQQAYDVLLREKGRGRHDTPGGAALRFHRRRSIGTAFKSVVTTTAQRITRRPVPPPRVR